MEGSAADVVDWMGGVLGVGGRCLGRGEEKEEEERCLHSRVVYSMQRVETRGTQVR